MTVSPSPENRRRPSAVLAAVLPALILLGACVPKDEPPAVAKAPAATADPDGVRPLVAYDYEEGRFANAMQSARGYCADAYSREAVAVSMDRDNLVATFACDRPL